MSSRYDQPWAGETFWERAFLQALPMCLASNGTFLEHGVAEAIHVADLAVEAAKNAKKRARE